MAFQILVTASFLLNEKVGFAGRERVFRKLTLDRKNNINMPSSLIIFMKKVNTFVDMYIYLQR